MDSDRYNDDCDFSDTAIIYRGFFSSSETALRP